MHTRPNSWLTVGRKTSFAGVYIYMTEWHSSYTGPDYENKDGS